MPRYADDLVPGTQIALGSHTLSEEEILDFARQWDPVYIHADPDAARAAGLDGVIASGLHTLAVYQRLAVAALWSDVAGGVGRGFDLRFRRPVRPGTTLTGRAVVESVTPRPERGDAVVAMTAELVDADDGAAVLTLALDSVITTRPPGRDHTEDRERPRTVGDPRG